MLLLFVEGRSHFLNCSPEGLNLQFGYLILVATTSVFEWRNIIIDDLAIVQIAIDIDEPAFCAIPDYLFSQFF
jgi:hypothetical protein